MLGVISGKEVSTNRKHQNMHKYPSNPWVTPKEHMCVRFTKKAAHESLTWPRLSATEQFCENRVVNSCLVKLEGLGKPLKLFSETIDESCFNNKDHIPGLKAFDLGQRTKTKINPPQ